MDLGGSDEESPLFHAFTVPSLAIENKNVNKTNDPIKPSDVPIQPVSETSHGDDKKQPTTIKSEQFEQFSTLPNGLQKFIVNDLVGTPLEDIDSIYKDKETFIVINRNNDLFRFSSSKALFLFNPINIIRRTAIRVLTHPIWAAFMIFVILVNCFTLMLIPGDKLLNIPWELIFLCIYILEFLIKILARGFVLSKFTYLRDPWNCFDLILIIIGFTAIAINPKDAIYGSPNYCELRVLKICSISFSLRRTVNIYWQSLVKMRDLLLYILFAMAVVAVTCVQMYIGTLTQRCVKMPLNARSDEAWSSFTNNSANFFYEDGMHRACGNSSGAQDCPTNYVCLQGNNLNPNYGYTSFDTAFRSFFVVFRLIQRDFWEETMQYLTATAGPWHILLFIALIYYGSFQICSLLWASIALAYNHLKDEQWENDLLSDLNEAQQQSESTSTDNKMVYIVEAVLKLTALEPAQYFRDKWNTFDFIVTALGVIELCLEGVQGLLVLRAFRVLEMKCVRHLFSTVGNQTIILCMFIYISVVFGCRAFGKNYIDNVHLFYGNELPRWNFIDIFHSFMVVFRSLCGEWVESLYDSMLVTNATSIVYFCELALVGSFAIMHLFVALILTNDDPTVPTDSIESRQSTIKSNRKFNLHTFLKEKLLEPNIQKIYDANKPIKTDVESQVDASSTTITLPSNQDDKNRNKNKDDKKPTAVASAEVKIANVNPSKVDANTVAPVATTEDDDEDDGTINKWSEFRVKALKFNENTYFGYIVLAIICIASIALVHTVNSFSLALTGTSFVVELAFCIVMIIEFISKTISCGWKSYFKNIWCLIDLFNTVVPIVGLFTVNQTILILKALRPISLVSRCSELKMVATTIAKQAKMLLNSLVICAAFWLIFAIMGVQMFGGKFYHCVDKNQTRLDVDFVPSQNACITKHYEWTNSPVNFDNVIEAYLSLLQVATFKGWIQLIQDAVDSREIDRQPLKESNIYVFFYFVLFIIFGVFICANVIVGILLKHIIQTGSLSDALGSSSKSKAPSNRTDAIEIIHNDTTSSKLAALARHKYFDWIAFGVCLFYIISLGFDHYMISENFVNILQYIDFVCGILFIIETGLRLHSLRRMFLLNFWNFYDSVTVILLLIEFSVMELSGGHIVSGNLLRVVRVIRFNKLLTGLSPTLKLVFEALRRSRKAAFNLCFLLFLMIFVYALIGAVAFKQVPKIFAINENVAFHSVGQALILMIQISTTAGWDGVYKVLAAEQGFNGFIITVYLWSFLFICILIIVNLVITVILNFYSNAIELEWKSKQLKSADLNDFNEKWRAIAAPENPLFINKTLLSTILNRLDKSSSLRANFSPNEENIKLLGIPLRNDQQIYRGDVLIALNKARLRQPIQKQNK